MKDRGGVIARAGLVLLSLLAAVAFLALVAGGGVDACAPFALFATAFAIVLAFPAPRGLPAALPRRPSRRPARSPPSLAFSS